MMKPCISMFYVEKKLRFRIFLLELGSDFQSYNASRMEFVKTNSTKLETSKKPLCQLPLLTQMFLPSVLQTVLGMTKKSL